MHFQFNIQPTETMQKPYNPSTLEIWIGGTEIIGTDKFINLQTETTEILDNGVRIERRNFKYPVAAIQSAITNFNIETGQAEIIPAAVNQLLAEFNLIIN